MRRRTDVEGGVALGRFEQVGPGVGDPFEHGPDHLGPARAAGEAEEGAPGAEVPLRGAVAEQGRHGDHAAGVVAGGGDGLRLAGRGQQAEVLDQPVDGRPGGQHDGLHAPGQAGRGSARR